MVFNSFEYALFLPLVLLLYWRLRHRGQNVLLLAASYLFYGWWDWRFLGLLAFTTAGDYLLGLRIGGAPDDRSRKRWLFASVAMNISVLGFFKYFNFFADSAATLLQGIGLEPNEATLRIILPVGISFYTFQSLSYTIDVYRRRLEPTRNLLDFAVFVAFFPQLVAGPIERARELLPQVQRDRVRPRVEQLRSGVFLIVLGLFRKIVIADALAPFVNEIFDGAASAPWHRLVAGVIAFALQIYGDFAGYSDIARGSSRLLGIELMRNFEQPYLSTSITAFWRAWHISLSTWLRDYLYVPLGGNRGTAFRTARNLMITMLLGGLWHGAAWTFVVWGGLHGTYLMAHRWLGAERAAATPAVGMRAAPKILGTFGLVCFAWIFFRAESFSQASEVIRGIVTLRGGAPDLDAMAMLLLCAIATLVIDITQRNAGSHEAVLAWPAPARGALYGAFGLGLLVFSGSAIVPFIYFQF